MRPHWGDDYGIACCVSAMRLGKQMQFFGARVNLAKALLYAINGGRDEISGDQIAPAAPPVTSDVLDYDEVMRKVRRHDGVAGADLRARDELHPLHARQVFLRAPRNGAARPRHPAHHGVRHRRPVGGGRQPGGDQIRQGPRDPRRRRASPSTIASIERRQRRSRNSATTTIGWTSIAADLVTRFMQKLRKHPTYRNATHTQSVLTITSNVVYGKATGNTPDGRRKGEPFGPGANPMHGRDSHGWLASCLSVAKLPYKDALDGISYTVSVAPQKAHLSDEELIDAAVKAFDMYFGQGGFHMNLNVIDKETLEDAMENPGQVSAAHDPGVGLCGQLRSPDTASSSSTSSAAPSTARSEREAGAMSQLGDSGGRQPARPARRHLARRAGRRRLSRRWRRRLRLCRIRMRPSSRYDGPGLRVVLFLSGCLLRCSYCHNPDTWHLKDGTYVSAQQVLDRLAQFRAGAARARRRPDDLGRRADGAARLHAAHPGCAPSRWACIPRSKRRAFSATARDDDYPVATSIWSCSTSRAAIRRPIAR